jgi:hypothetical protein
MWRMMIALLEVYNGTVRSLSGIIASESRHKVTEKTYATLT